MSDKKQDDQNDATNAPYNAITEALSVIINKSTNELVFTDPKTGQAFTISAKVAESNETEAEEIKPLSPEEFRTALQKLDALGLTWTADGVPQIKPKESVSDEVFLTEEFDRIREAYPELPVELSAIVFHLLTGSQPSATLVGSQSDLQEKAKIVDDLLITQGYKSEFFFKHAIKVPYLRDIDWEVVLKVSERNVKKPPLIPYALLSLIFLDPNRPGGSQRTFTVAVDAKLVNDLISILNEVKDRLQHASQASEAIKRLEGESHETGRKEILE